MNTEQEKGDLGLCLVVFGTGILALFFLLTYYITPKPRSEPTQVERHEGFVNEGFVEMEPTQVRTYSPRGFPLKGPKCQLQGRGYSAHFKAPATVLIPDYGQESPLPTVTCSRYGKTVAVQAILLNKTVVGTTWVPDNREFRLVPDRRKMESAAYSGARQNEADDDYGFWPILLKFKGYGEG